MLRSLQYAGCMKKHMRRSQEECLPLARPLEPVLPGPRRDPSEGPRYHVRPRALADRACNDDEVGVVRLNKARAALGIEPRTSRTRSENHATRPSSQLVVARMKD